jgi:alpha-amylase/alpha-mannosidase (GH57 family)
MSEKKHVIHIRDLDDETYRKMWALRKRWRTGNWVNLLRILVDVKYKEVEKEWLL